MRDDMRYTGSECFETFPFPRQFIDNESKKIEAKFDIYWAIAKDNRNH